MAHGAINILSFTSESTLWHFRFPFHSIPTMAMPMDAVRPTMRRKSSAQNLLSSFKPSPNSASHQSSSYPATPTVPTPARDFDMQSSQDSIATGSTLVGGQNVQGTSVEYLRDLVQKRIITLTYMRNVHEG